MRRPSHSNADRLTPPTPMKVNIAEYRNCSDVRPATQEHRPHARLHSESWLRCPARRCALLQPGKLNDGARCTQHGHMALATADACQHDRAPQSRALSRSDAMQLADRAKTAPACRAGPNVGYPHASRTNSPHKSSYVRMKDESGRRL